MYTPRGLSGSADDITLHYPVHKVRLLLITSSVSLSSPSLSSHPLLLPSAVAQVRYPSLAASGREATALNDAIDADELRQYNDWLRGTGPRPSDAIVEKY